jgi:hypothetical protein
MRIGNADPHPGSLVLHKVTYFPEIFKFKACTVVASCTVKRWTNALICILIYINKTLLLEDLDPDPHSVGTVDPDRYRYWNFWWIRNRMKRMLIRNTGLCSTYKYDTPVAKFLMIQARNRWPCREFLNTFFLLCFFWTNNIFPHIKIL